MGESSRASTARLALALMQSYGGNTDAQNALREIDVPAVDTFTDRFSETDKWEDLTIQNTLHLAHPDHFVKPVDRRCNFVDFASAGHAIATLDSNCEALTRSRKTIATYESWDRDDQYGLIDSLEFTKYNLKWKDDDFIFYLVPGFDCNFLLHKCEGNESIRGNSKAIDELMTAGTNWLESVDRTLLVFDDDWITSPSTLESIRETSWDDVVLSITEKVAIQEDVEGFFSGGGTYKSLHVPWKRGIILYGPAGNGKTMAMEAMMGAVSKRRRKVSCIYIKSIKNEYDVEIVFKEAKKMAPCLLVVEDLDTLSYADAEELAQQIDDLESSIGMMIAATATDLQKLPPQFSAQPFRFDRNFHFPNPNHYMRVEYCDQWRNKIICDDKIEFPPALSESIAANTDNLSFINLREVFLASLMKIAARSTSNEGSGDDDATLADDSRQDNQEKYQSEDVENLPLAVEIKEQVETLREYLRSSSKSSKRASRFADDDDRSWHEVNLPEEETPTLPNRPKNTRTANYMKWWRQ